MNNTPIKGLLKELLRDIIYCKDAGIIFNKTHYPVFTIVLEKLKRCESHDHITITDLRHFMMANFCMHLLRNLQTILYQNLQTNLDNKQDQVELFFERMLKYILLSGDTSGKIKYVRLRKFRYKINKSDNGHVNVRVWIRPELGYDLRDVAFFGYNNKDVELRIIERWNKHPVVFGLEPDVPC